MSDESPGRPYSRAGQYAKAIALIALISVALYALGRVLNRDSSQHIEAAAPRAQDASNPATPAHAAAASTSATDDPSRTWVRQEFTSEIDDSKTLTYATAATDDLQGWLKATRPILMARCSKHRLDAVLVTQMATSVEYGDRTGHHVRVRFDDGAISSQRWTESTTNDGLFASNPTAFLATLAKSKRLRIELTPFNSTPKVIDFQIAPFYAPYAELLGACGSRSVQATRKPR